MASLAAVFNHLVLPPQIPGEQDADVEAISKNILGRLFQAATTLGKLAGQENETIWKGLQESLRRCQYLHEFGHLEVKSLKSEFQRLTFGEPLLLHIAEQNAALIIRRDVSGQMDVVVFEAFETSPPSADVLACERSLIWDFPDCAAQLSFNEFQSSSFRHALADFLEKGSSEPLRQFQALTTKANVSIVESRDTASPALVTHLLLPVIEALGSAANVSRLRKRVRDDVNFQSAEYPWRRLPFWLSLRIFAQRQLQLSLGHDRGRACYKILIATMLTELLKDCPGRLAPEMTLILRAKICRRLAKLEQEKFTLPAVSGDLFVIARPFFEETIIQTTKLVEPAWDRYKREIRRSVPRLAFRAESQSLYLTLPNSGLYLHGVLDLPRVPGKAHRSWNLPPLHDGAIEQVERFTDTYFELAKMEHEISSHQIPRFPSKPTPQSRCIAFVGAIANYFSIVGQDYESNPEQASTFILSLFILWVRLDKEIVQICPLFAEYHPGFTPELLNPLHLPAASQMQHLRLIQKYLQDRCTACKHQRTIFSESDEQQAFAIKYVARNREMQGRLQQIRAASDVARHTKKTELEAWQREYDERSLGISSGTCVCKMNRDNTRNVKGCTRCWHRRKRNKMSIHAHEDFLPEDGTKAASVVFELFIPNFIAKYRDVTWKIFKLAHPDEPTSVSPTTLLHDYGSLKSYGKGFLTNITLASTSKSFRDTHYKVSKKKMRASELDVLYPNGLSFCYFDMVSETWIKDFNKPLTFQHLCGVYVPPPLLCSVMPKSTHPPAKVQGPSSYEIVASETRCPSSLSVHEFTTYQRLISGTSRRWLTMLIELGASDLNFSSESTMHMFNHLATQAGPAKDDYGFFGEVHAIFKDPNFCDRLAEQIGSRLRNIKSNWREVYCMELLITLCLRLFTLGSSKRRASHLLREARSITLDWITCLRTNVRSATEASIAETAARYAFWAALLCRRTFSIVTDDEHVLLEDELTIFVQASLALQENLLVDLAKLDPLLKSMFIRDTKTAYRLQPLVLRSIKACSKSIGIAINASWSSSKSSSERNFADWKVLPSPHGRWAATTMTSSMTTSANSQVVHYNFIEGHLLVDGKSLGRLPRDIRESTEVEVLFGKQHLLTFPSSEIGMSYTMATRYHQHEIHFGYRNGNVIIRARGRDALFEYVPSKIFIGHSNAVDLPLGLVYGCVHWLNLKMKRLEIRRQAAPWKPKASDWIIDVTNRHGRRRDVFLVDPNSTFSKSVVNIFRDFENPSKITVYQPMKGHLCVELRHLELSFFVNGGGWLECRELGEEIDPDQNAGTLYGLGSKIVLRDVKEPNRRSLIVPLGKITTQRRGMHVAVRAASNNEYARFGIDDVLGRLSCPAEPRLLYAKAQLHAFTSFAIPDPLTGRTGTEEALAILQSGSSQPWTPLGALPVEILKTIAGLSPKRTYYPKDRQNLQSVDWSPDLTMTIQNDAFEGLIQHILLGSNRLQTFAPRKENEVEIITHSSLHLRKRAMTQRRLHERSTFNTTNQTGCDNAYISRGQQANTMQASRVYHITNLLQAPLPHAHTTQKLARILQAWPLIGGFHSMTNLISISLSEAIERNVEEQWGSLVNLCRSCGPEHFHGLMFQLGLLSLNSKIHMDVFQILTAIAISPELKTLQPPSSAAFNHFKLNESPTVQSIFKIISVDLPEKPKWKGDKVQEAHWKTCKDEAQRLAQHVVEQWPDYRVSLEDFESTAIDTTLAMEHINIEWRRLCNNSGLSRYVIQIQEILKLHEGPQAFVLPKTWELTQTPPRTPDHDSILPSLATDLLVKRLDLHVINNAKSNLDLKSPPALLPEGRSSTSTPSKEVHNLREILSCFTASSNSLRREYGHDLDMSLAALEKTRISPKSPATIVTFEALDARIADARAIVVRSFNQIRDALSADDDRFKWLGLGELWPCNTSLEVLANLRSSANQVFGSGVKELLVSHGASITNLQQLLRVKHAHCHQKTVRLYEEIANPGHENWDPLQFPDWLLLEIDSDIMIRAEQVDVAHAIIAPRSKENTVLQLNMGKGKTSCIVPMAIAVLGDRTQLSRLIVPKSLLLPTAQILQSRLGGLVGREIRHVPFSRRTGSDPETLQLYKDLHLEIFGRCGVVLNAPEHVLSFKLSGLQHLAGSDLNIAEDMIAFQSWLNTRCRDILDESDVSLAVKTQLIYPSGKQHTVDGYPQRWQVAQLLLSLIEDHLPHLQQQFPRSIEVTDRGQGYPMICFLKPDVENAIHERIIHEICTGRTAFLRFEQPASANQSADVHKILSDARFDDKLFKGVASLFSDEESACKNLLLVRGLLTNRILLLCLKKRWNVQYGLHPKRDPIAVPFEAKSVPSEQAEFGHPDVAIILTCLAFYYSGLNPRQFSDGLRLVLSSHDPSSEYDRWTSGCDTLPEALSHWNAINIDDRSQIETLWGHLRTNRTVLIHYMNHFVFPTHAKQFSIKLQASGWDIPLFSKSTGRHDALTQARTTGFSGTNDNKIMLPLTIRQDDLPSLHQTNAEVLTSLLQDRNREYYLAAQAGECFSEREFLGDLQLKGIRVLIDAGAFVLEMSNDDLAKLWLDIDGRAKAAVFFSHDNRAMVRYRGKKDLVPLLATSLVDNLENCVVYLDEAHTRGVDLKLPQKARGALTLALGQTKDHTVQAAMRLRQLATTQSVSFFALPATHQSILDVCNLKESEKVGSSHVIHWLLEQTCCANEQLQNLYVSQGIDFCDRQIAEWTNPNFITNRKARDAYIKVIQRPEQQTLEELYGNTVVKTLSTSTVEHISPHIQVFIDKLNNQRRVEANKENVLHSSALDEVEQEREVEFQVEEVREVQKPVHYKAFVFPGLHPAIYAFLDTGVLYGGEGYEHVFTAMSHTLVGRKFNVTHTTSRLYASVEFMRTIDTGRSGSIDNFQRPVEWVLYSSNSSTALIVIAEEAELIIPMLRIPNARATVHLLTYSAPVTKKMQHFSNLAYYALPALPTNHVIPRWLTIELGIFAGGLYMEFDEAMALVDYIEGKDNEAGRAHGLGTNPTSMLLEWSSLRRKGQDIVHTPIGYICQGRPLDRGHAFFVKQGADTQGTANAHRIEEDVDDSSEEEQDEEDEEDGVDDSELASGS